MNESFLTSLVRNYTVLKKRFPNLRNSLPYWLVKGIKNLEAKAVTTQVRLVDVKSRADSDYVVHCCTQKTGSVWIKTMLSDPVVFRYTGLVAYAYSMALHEKVIKKSENVPLRSIVTPLRGTCDDFMALEKILKGNVKAFFVARDPRDLIISWYFSTRSTHFIDKKRNPDMVRRREDLQKLEQEDGFLYAIDFFKNDGRFTLLEAWIKACVGDERRLLVKYDDLVGENKKTAFRGLFDFIGAPIPDEAFDQLLEAYSFERLSGRKAGEENASSHLRSGKSGEWCRYFTPNVEAAFREATGDLVETMGYSWTGTNDGV